MHSVQLGLRQALFAGAVLAIPGVAQAGSFTYTAMEPPGGGTYIYATGIYQDQVVGFSSTANNGWVGYVWSNGKYTMLPAIPQIAGVSDSGVAVGIAANSQNAYAAYDLTSQSIQKHIAVKLPAGQYLHSVNGINASGTIAALGAVPHGRGSLYQPLEQDMNGNVTLLHKLSRKRYEPVGISDAGVVPMAAGYDNAVYKHGKFQNFHTPPNVSVLHIGFVSNTGLFGGSYFANDNGMGFTSTGHALTAYSQPGWTAVTVAGAGGLDEVVGSYLDAASASHGFIYRNGVYYTVDYPGSGYTSITGVGAHGSIIGYAETDGSRITPFIALCAHGGFCTR